MFARRASWGCLLFLSLLPVLATGCNRADATPAAPAPPKVTVGHPELRTIVDEEEYGGWLRAVKTVEVRARVRGHIDKVHFQDGDLVEKDQLLFELDPRPFQVEIDETMASANALKAQQAAAEKELARDRELARKGAVTQQELEKAEADALSFAARYAAALQQADRFKLDLEYAQIKSPISGRIGRAQLTEGNLVNAGGSDPLLATIVSTNPIHAYFMIDERTVQRYRNYRRTNGNGETYSSLREREVPFRFGLDSDDGFPHSGVLDFADNQVDSATGTIEVRGIVNNEDGRFIAGSRIRVRVPMSDPYEALLVPDSAILADQEKRYVLIIDDKNTVLRRDIQPGKLLDDGMRVVLPPKAGERLTKNDRLITLGLQRARINYPVEPIEARTTSATGGAAAPPAGETTGGTTDAGA